VIISRNYASIIVLLMSVSVIIALTYFYTHLHKQQLAEQLSLQQQQLKRLASVQTASSALQPITPKAATPALEWLLAEWADQFSLQLTLQHDPASHASFRATIAGQPSELFQYLNSFIRFTRIYQPTPYTHQMLSLTRTNDNQGQLKWHFSQNSESAFIKPLTTLTHTDNHATCQTLPAFLTPVHRQNLPTYNNLRLIAVVRNRAKHNAAQAYFLNTEGHWLALQKGDWLQQPLSQIIAINNDNVSLQQWRQQSQCWLNHKVELNLKDVL